MKETATRIALAMALIVTIIAGITISTQAAEGKATTALFEGIVTASYDKVSAKGNNMHLLVFETVVEDFGIKYKDSVTVFAFNDKIAKAQTVEAGKKYKVIYTRGTDGFCMYKHHEPIK